MKQNKRKNVTPDEKAPSRNANPAKKSKNLKLDTQTRNLILMLVGFSVLLTFFAYLPVLKAEFINLDDNDYAYANETIRSFGNLKRMITEPLQGNYHPLTVMSLAFNYALSKDNPGSYHLLNLLLHLANTALVFFFVWQLSGRKMVVAFCASLFFGVHPMHVESVAWVSERKDVLYTFFYLLGLIAYLRSVDRNDKKALLLCMAAFVLSIASKPAAIVFPLTLLCIDLYREREWKLSLLTEKVVFFVISGIMALLTLRAQSAGGATDTSNAFGLDQRFFFGFYSFMMYMVKLVVPVDLAIFYPLPTMHVALPALYYAAPLVMAACAAVGFMTYKKNRIYAFGLLFFFVNLLLVLQWKVIGSTIMAERYTYVPYIGLFVILGWLLNKVMEGKQTLALGSIAGLGAVFAMLTYSHAQTFSNNTMLWDNAVEHQPSERAYTNRASLLRTEGKMDSALVLYDKGLKLFPNDQWALCNRANIYFDKHQDSLALEDYSMALKIVPDFAPALTNRGALYARAGKFDLALADLNRAIAVKPEERSPYLYRAISLLSMGRYADAIPDYEHVLEGRPGDIDSRFSLGNCYKNTQQYEKALNSYNQCIAQRPQAQYLQARAECNALLGHMDQARSDAQAAMRGGAGFSPQFLHQIGM